MPDNMIAADDPTIDPESARWWEALDAGRLTVLRCGECGDASLYVRSTCPNCWSEEVVLEPVSGTAHLYSWSEVHQNGPPFAGWTPYVAAIVDLVEGPRLMTVIDGTAAADLEAGMELAMALRKTSGGHTVPVFRAAR